MIYKKLAAEVIGLEKDESLVARAMAVTCVDRATTNAADAVAMADMVILAVPMLAYGPLLDRLVPLMKKNAILSDVGSVKQTALDAMLAAIKKHDRADIKPIPAHPIAGTEFSGPESGKA
ncbi:MAG: prephenate dehydrogenase/arogenate dehydrogenase family protein, partial [Alphaproteobacteria bacterium]|nr:prephenate dehydrogenase/arogenate dehydrogenase family protein [Alphaproteobacteria bacterium]